MTNVNFDTVFFMLGQSMASNMRNERPRDYSYYDMRSREAAFRAPRVDYSELFEVAIQIYNDTTFRAPRVDYSELFEVAIQIYNDTTLTRLNARDTDIAFRTFKCGVDEFLRNRHASTNRYTFTTKNMLYDPACFDKDKDAFDNVQYQMGCYYVDGEELFVVYHGEDSDEFSTFDSAERFCHNNTRNGVDWITEDAPPHSILGIF